MTGTSEKTRQPQPLMTGQFTDFSADAHAWRIQVSTSAGPVYVQPSRHPEEGADSGKAGLGFTAGDLVAAMVEQLSPGPLAKVLSECAKDRPHLLEMPCGQADIGTFIIAASRTDTSFRFSLPDRTVFALMSGSLYAAPERSRWLLASIACARVGLAQKMWARATRFYSDATPQVLTATIVKMLRSAAKVLPQGHRDVTRWKEDVNAMNFLAARMVSAGANLGSYSAPVSFSVRDEAGQLKLHQVQASFVLLMANAMASIVLPYDDKHGEPALLLTSLAKTLLRPALDAGFDFNAPPPPPFQYPSMVHMVASSMPRQVAEWLQAEMLQRSLAAATAAAPPPGSSTVPRQRL